LNLSSKVRKREKQSASGTLDAFSLGVPMADVLARPAARPDFGLGDVFSFERGDIVMKWNLWPVPFQNTLAVGIDLAMEYRFHASPLKPQIEAPYPGKE